MTKFKQILSQKKIVAPVFWKQKGIILIDFVAPVIEKLSEKVAKNPDTRMLCRNFEETCFAISKSFEMG